MRFLHKMMEKNQLVSLPMKKENSMLQWTQLPKGIPNMFNFGFTQPSTVSPQCSDVNKNLFVLNPGILICYCFVSKLVQYFLYGLSPFFICVKFNCKHVLRSFIV